MDIGKPVRKFTVVPLERELDPAVPEPVPKGYAITYNAVTGARLSTTPVGAGAVTWGPTWATPYWGLPVVAYAITRRLDGRPEPIEDGGIRVGEIVGWRCWRLHATGRLASISMVNILWEPGVPMTAGKQFELGPMYEGLPWEAAFDHGVCGVHAWKTKAEALRYAYDGMRGGGGLDVLLLGSIKLSGRVYEHERGYRAEFGSIASLDDVIADKHPRLTQHGSAFYRNRYETMLRTTRTMYGVGGEGGWKTPEQANEEGIRMTLTFGSDAGTQEMFG